MWLANQFGDGIPHRGGKKRIRMQHATIRVENDAHPLDLVILCHLLGDVARQSDHTNHRQMFVQNRMVCRLEPPRTAVAIDPLVSATLELSSPKIRPEFCDKRAIDVGVVAQIVS